MSLATAGIGGLGGASGGSGLSMANNVHAMARPAAPQPPPQGNVPLGATPGAPPSLGALGADLLDKNQSLSLKQVRNLSRYPIVAVDLYGSGPHVAMFPAKPKEPSNTLMPTLVGKLKSQISLKQSELAHKTLRKWLTKSKGYDSLCTDSLAPNGILIDRPHELLGARRLADVPDLVKESFSSIESEEPTHVISEEASSSVGVTVANGTLDGVSTPTGDDFDRVVFKVRLHESKKALTILPEEAVSLVLAVAQSHVARKVPKVDEENAEEAQEYPVAVAVPAWACHDAAMEALLDATGGTGVVFQRSIAALAGALLPRDDGNEIIERLNHVRTAKYKEYEKEDHDEAGDFEYASLVLLVGVSDNGIECTAVQVSKLQGNILCCVFGSYKVLTSVSCRHGDPVSQIEHSVRDVHSNLKAIAPEADGPVGFVTYGNAKTQKVVVAALESTRKKIEDWDSVPIMATRSDCVSMGLAVLGGVSHGRVRTMAEDNKKKAQLAIRIQDVAPTAVGIRVNYHGGSSNKWGAVKTIFDFDRRVPAGPYQIDLNAAECAAIRASSMSLSEEELLKATKEQEGSKAIPQREEAALNLRVQVVQKLERGQGWIKVGDVMSPLVKIEGDEDGVKVACERITLELGLGPTGVITSCLSGERESVVQATVSARNSKLRYYIGILLAIAFCGGFLVKSYVEERIFEHDTRRLLHYYKHVVPGSFNDGDPHNARYLVWKYKGKKAKLWRRLENKYGEPVLTIQEYEEIEKAEAEKEGGEGEDDIENLDDDKEEEVTDHENEEPDL